MTTAPYYLTRSRASASRTVGRLLLTGVSFIVGLAGLVALLLLAFGIVS